MAAHPEAVTAENFLLAYGHVGFQFEGKDGGIIWGFGPDMAKYLPKMSLSELNNRLNRRETFDGKITNDTEIFRKAAEVPEIRDGVIVVEYSYELAHFEAIYNNFLLLRRFPGKYMFPDKIPPYYNDNAANCATWPAKLGLTIPELSGILKTYQEAAITKAATNPNPVKR